MGWESPFRLPCFQAIEEGLRKIGFSPSFELKYFAVKQERTEWRRERLTPSLEINVTRPFSKPVGGELYVGDLFKSDLVLNLCGALIAQTTERICETFRVLQVRGFETHSQKCDELERCLASRNAFPEPIAYGKIA